MYLKTGERVKKQVERLLSRLEQFDREVRDHLKMARVSGDNRIAEMQSGRANQQVLEWNFRALLLLLCVDLASQECDLLRKGIDWQRRPAIPV